MEGHAAWNNWSHTSQTRSHSFTHWIKEKQIQLEPHQDDIIKSYNKNNNSISVFIKDNQLIGVFGISDQVKETSKHAIQQLKAEAIDIYMLTGDQQKAGEYIAKEVGIDHVIGNSLPQDKLAYVEKLQKEGKVVAEDLEDAAEDVKEAVEEAVEDIKEDIE